MSEEIAKTETPELTPKVDVVAEVAPVVDVPKVETPAVVEAAQAAAAVVETKKVEAVPEKIELKLPEKSPLAADAIEKITSFAKEQGLTQKQAQAILEREISSEAGRSAALIETNKKLSEEWKITSSKDKDIGGENFTQNVSYAQQALKTFGNEAFTRMVDDTGLGNHPEVLRFMARVGKAMANDKVVHGEFSAPKKGQKSIASKFYPDMESSVK